MNAMVHLFKAGPEPKGASFLRRHTGPAPSFERISRNIVRGFISLEAVSRIVTANETRFVTEKGLIVEPAFDCGWIYPEGRGSPWWDYRRGDAGNHICFEA